MLRTPQFCFWGSLDKQVCISQILLPFGNKCRLFAWTSSRTPLIPGAESCTMHTLSNKAPGEVPTTVEHACAATVVEGNPPASNQLQPRSVCNKGQASSRKRMLNLVSEVDTEEQLSKLSKLEIQGKFLEWTDVMHSDLTWRRLIFGMSDGELRFSLQAVTNTTPTPDNLRRCGNSEIDSACSLCGQTCTLRHVLNACKVLLLQGRYLWRHKLILGCLQN